MSIDFMNRVWWREDLAMTEKFVLLALADAANDDEGMCYPAIATIALKCSCHPRTVQNAIRSLEGKQLLRIMQRQDRSSYYILNRANLPYVDRSRRAKERGPQYDLSTGGADSPDMFGTGESGSVTGGADSMTGGSEPPRTINEPSIESSLSDSEISSLFVERWNALADEVEAIQPIVRFGKREAALLARVDEYVPKRNAVAVTALIDRVIDTVRGSRFLRNESNKPFVANPAWVCTPKYFPKLVEVGYAQDANAGAGGQPAAGADRSVIAAGQAARDVLHARGGTTRRSARQLAG